MIFNETKLKDAFIIEPERIEDERGFFARIWCQQEFKSHGLVPDLRQCSISFNKKKFTLRGMHFQLAPHQETKLVRCTKGSIYDVIIDIRPGSKTFKQWTSVNLSSENRMMIYIPRDFVHGFLTLEDNTEVIYQMSEFYAPEFARGIRWNDPAFNILWPADINVISEKDKAYPDFKV